MTKNMVQDKAVLEWLDSAKGKGTLYQYKNRFEIWLQYCKAKMKFFGT